MVDWRREEVRLGLGVALVELGDELGEEREPQRGVPSAAIVLMSRPSDSYSLELELGDCPFPRLCTPHVTWSVAVHRMIWKVGPP